MHNKEMLSLTKYNIIGCINYRFIPSMKNILVNKSSSEHYKSLLLFSANKMA